MHANLAIIGQPDHAVVRHLLSVVQAGTNDLAPLNPLLANGHSLKRTPSNPLPAREFNLKAYAAINRHK